MDNTIVRVDADPKIKRLGARVQVIQDRITVSPENRARLVEAIEIALRFGKGKINVIPSALEAGGSPGSSKTAAVPTTLAIPLSTARPSPACDPDTQPPTPPLF